MLPASVSSRKALWVALVVLLVTLISFVRQTNNLLATRQTFSAPLEHVIAKNNVTAADTTDNLKLVWLLSFPNSGTSYTMLLVERASQLSTVTHHGKEVATPQGTSIPMFNDTVQGGPYWEGLVNAKGTVRPLPPPGGYALTKTHCGSRCANCGLDTYQTTLERFTRDCQKTTGRWPRPDGSLELVTSYVPLSMVAKLVWLMRNPMENVVSRYHLERRNWLRKAAKDASLTPLVEQFHPNATGFQNWCRYLDATYESDASLASRLWPVDWELWSSVPCRGEFYRWTQWHNLVGQMVQITLQDRPLLHWYYEDYAATNETAAVDMFLHYLQQTRTGPIKKFRTPMPVYRLTHYSTRERSKIWQLLERLATNQTFRLLGRYYDEHLFEDDVSGE